MAYPFNSSFQHFCAQFRSWASTNDGPISPCSDPLSLGEAEGFDVDSEPGIHFLTLCVEIKKANVYSVSIGAILGKFFQHRRRGRVAEHLVATGQRSPRCSRAKTTSSVSKRQIF